jgi:hypothetical protein
MQYYTKKFVSSVLSMNRILNVFFIVMDYEVYVVKCWWKILYIKHLQWILDTRGFIDYFYFQNAINILV